MCVRKSVCEKVQASLVTNTEQALAFDGVLSPSLPEYLSPLLTRSARARALCRSPCVVFTASLFVLFLFFLFFPFRSLCGFVVGEAPSLSLFLSFPKDSRRFFGIVCLFHRLFLVHNFFFIVTMSQSTGIAKLAQAEELANRQIAQAKERRAQRIQEAKNSAAEQLAQQRAKYQADFDLQEAQVHRL